MDVCMASEEKLGEGVVVIFRSAEKAEEVPIAVGVIILIIFLNSLGSSVGGGVQVIFTVFL